MKRQIAFTLLLLVSMSVTAQQTEIKWSSEINFNSQKSTDYEIADAGDAGIFLRESHVHLNRLSFSNPFREAASLVKFDKDLTQQFATDFTKELKGKEFENIFFLKGRIILVATASGKEDNSLSVYAVAIDKNTGGQTGEWTELGTAVKDSKKEQVFYKAGYNADSSAITLVSTIVAKQELRFQVFEADENLKITRKPVQFSITTEPDEFWLRDVLVLKNGNVFVVSKIFEKDPGSKYYGPNYHYQVQLFGKNGHMIRQEAFGDKEIWLVNARAEIIPSGELLLTGFYTYWADRKKDGILVKKMDPATGLITAKSTKEFTSQSLQKPGTGNPIVDDKLFTLRIKFRKFIPLADGSIIVHAEQFKQYQKDAGLTGSDRSSYISFDCNNIYVYKITPSSETAWLNIIPKQQYESVQTYSAWPGGLTTNFLYEYQYYYQWPFLASYAAQKSGNKILFIFNDDEANAGVKQYGQQAKLTDNEFGKSTCYAAGVDVNTGAVDRVAFFSNKNKDNPIAMPKYSRLFNNDLYIPGIRGRVFGKTKLALAKITVPPGAGARQ